VGSKVDLNAAKKGKVFWKTKAACTIVVLIREISHSHLKIYLPYSPR